MSDRGFHLATALFDQHRTNSGFATEFDLLGHSWEVLDGVFDPSLTPVTELFSAQLPYPEDGSYLDMGCGAGVTAVYGAMSGCRRVTALDISWTAVDNTRRNVKRHGMEDRVRVAHSNLFSALAPEERFDLIFWNSNFAEPPSGFVNDSELHHAFFDPGYDAHRRFLQQAPDRLSAGGRLLLGFSNLGNAEQLGADCSAAGLDIQQVWSAIHTTQRSGPSPVDIEFQLLELVPR